MSAAFASADAVAALATDASGKAYLELFTHGSLAVEVYKPVGRDLQTAHARDEVYVVIAGHGTFACNGERTTFGPGALLFVPAGVEHRFEHFTDDFSTWVLFYGPHGGEHDA